MIQLDKLDEAMLQTALRMDANDPQRLLRKWLRFFPACIYPYVVAEYRRAIGEPSFAVLKNGERYTEEARRLIEEFNACQSDRFFSSN